jgi:hypothetical protein
MRVHDLEIVVDDDPAEPPRNPQVEPRAPSELNHGHAFFAHARSKEPHSVEANHHRGDACSQPADRLGHEYFGARNLHDVKDEPDANGIRAARLHGRKPPK